MSDKVRELLLPTLALTILVSLWAVAKMRNAEEDVATLLPPATPEIMLRASEASAASDATPAVDPG